MNFTGLKFYAHKNAPSMLVGAGIVGMVAAAIGACQATIHAADILEEHKRDMEEIHALRDKAIENGKDEDKTEDKVKKLTVARYVQTTKQLTKVYAGSVLLGLAGATFIVKSHTMMHSRNMKLAGTLASTLGLFNSYRENVRKDQGIEKDLAYLTGAEEVEVEKEVTDKKGRTKTTTEKVLMSDPDAKGNGYLRYMTSASPRWWNEDDKMMEINIQRAENWANDRLHSMHRLTVQELYDEFGFVTTNGDEGDYLSMGWIYDDTIKDHVKLNYCKTTLPGSDGSFVKAWAIDPNVARNIITTYHRRRAKALPTLKGAVA